MNSKLVIRVVIGVVILLLLTFLTLICNNCLFNPSELGEGSLPN
jgi:hypothetical protein